MNARLAGQAVDALGAAAVEPAFDVLHDHARVAAGAVERDGAGGDLDADGVVVGVRHRGRGREARADQRPERVGGGLHVEDVGDPAAQEALARFPFLVGLDGLAGHPVDVGVGIGERGGHATDGYCAVLE